MCTSDLALSVFVPGWLVAARRGSPSMGVSPFPAPPRLFAVIVSMFEKRLKELNPSLPTISYDIADLYSYLDTFHDFSALVYGDPFPAMSCLC